MLKKLLQHPWAIIITSLVITVVLGFQLRGVEIENNVRIYMPHDSDSYRTMLNTEDTFGSMIGLGVSLETTEKSIVTPENIQIVKNISDRCESIKFIDSVDSLTNIDYIYGENGSLIAGSLLTDSYAGSAEDIKTIKQKIMDWQEMYNRVILTDDGKATQIMLLLSPKDESGNALSEKEQTNALHQVQKICEEEVQGHNLEVRYFGDPVLSDDAHAYMMSDLIVLIPFVVLVVLLSLYFSFHSFAGTVLPLITVLMSTIWATGIMAVLHIKFTIVSSTIPVCLIACGSALCGAG